MERKSIGEGWDESGQKEWVTRIDWSSGGWADQKREKDFIVKLIEQAP